MSVETISTGGYVKRTSPPEERAVPEGRERTARIAYFVAAVALIGGECLFKFGQVAIDLFK